MLKYRLDVCGSSVLSIFFFFFSSHLLFSSAFQACGDPKAKPSYLVDKNLESAVKFIVRKFPAVETRNNNVSMPACMSAVCLYGIERKRMKGWLLNLDCRFIFLHIVL